MFAMHFSMLGHFIFFILIKNFTNITNLLVGTFEDTTGLPDQLLFYLAVGTSEAVPVTESLI
jgi:hypothetical protein